MEATLKQVYLHAFIAYCYSSGKTGPNDLLNPLVKKTIATLDKKVFTTEEIQKEIVKDFSKDFPLILIEREMHKLSSLGIIQNNFRKEIESEYTLVEDLSEIKNSFRSSQDETNHFLAEFRKFLHSKNSEYGDLKLSSLLKRIESFCNENMIPIIDFFGKKVNVIKKEKIDKSIDLLIEDFFNECVRTDEKLLIEFERIFHGISLIYLYENCMEEIATSDYSLNEKCFYLDTNILLRVLRLQSDYLNKIGLELYNVLIKYKFSIKVFRITLDELFALIRGYDKACAYFVKGKNISHVYQTLKNRGYEAFQIDDIQEEIKKRLFELNIEIDETTKWLPSDYKEFEDNIEKLSRQKFDRKFDDELKLDFHDDSISKYLYQAKHDMRCIELIRALRNNVPKIRFEDEKYFFITAESLLLQFNKSISEKERVKETIGDFTLCFLLFFHDPKNVKGIALHSFIAANYNNTELSVTNWIKYVGIIQQKYERNEINTKQMGFLFTKTILTNNRFETEDLGDIINEGLSEYSELVGQYESLKSEKKKADDENLKLREENLNNISKILKKSEEAGRLFDRIDTLENNQTSLNSQLYDLRKQMKLIRKALFIIFSLMIILAIIILFSNKMVGSILLIFGITLDILNIVDRYKKIFIKD